MGSAATAEKHSTVHTGMLWEKNSFRTNLWEICHNTQEHELNEITCIEEKNDNGGRIATSRLKNPNSVPQPKHLTPAMSRFLSPRCQVSSLRSLT